MLRHQFFNFNDLNTSIQLHLISTRPIHVSCSNMRAFHRLLAVPSSVGTQSAGLRPVPLALLPPIPLYRRILRAHRKHLEPEQRIIGDKFVKKEFHDHKDVENPVHIVGFLTEWQTYAQTIEGEQWRGEKMDPGKIDKMSGMYA
jgi:hypothetical protein